MAEAEGRLYGPKREDCNVSEGEDAEAILDRGHKRYNEANSMSMRRSITVTFCRLFSGFFREVLTNQNLEFDTNDKWQGKLSLYLGPSTIR
jgi:hypothetical protein